MWVHLLHTLQLVLYFPKEVSFLQIYRQMIPTESSEMPVSEIDVIAASAENNVQIEIEENQKRVKKNTTMEVAFNKVNYHFLK